MRSAIGIGGTVLPVEVEEATGGFVARVSGTAAVGRELVGEGETYEAALTSLRTLLIAERQRRDAASAA